MRNELARKLECNIFAGVYPEDKFQLVRALQQSGHVIGMTGDGVNDAPALKQAEVGIAAANGTDVAKSAASLVLTSPGLSDIVASVETSRRIYQRMLTYTLNKIIKPVEIGFFLSLGVLLTRECIITLPLIVLLLFTNDFVTMSIATDHVSFSSTPDRWRIGRRFNRRPAVSVGRAGRQRFGWESRRPSIPDSRLRDATPGSRAFGVRQQPRMRRYSRDLDNRPPPFARAPTP